MARSNFSNMFSRLFDASIDADFRFAALFDADSTVRTVVPAGGKAGDARWLAGGSAIEAGGVPSAATSASLFPTTTDTVADDISTSATLTVGAPHVIGTLDTIGDQDFFRVELVAGQSYEIGQYAYTGGPSGLPNTDSYIEIYDAAGHLIVSADGGADTAYNQINSGFDVLMTFTPEVSGTYYVNARGFDEDATNGTTGDSVGDYELFVREASPSAYKPYYDVDSPLYSIDWGTQVDNTSRNPDGEEGPRPTGNAETGYAWNPYGIEGKNVITYYFAKQGEIFIDEDPTTPGTTETMIAKGFADWEKAVYLDAFGEYAKVADLVYVEVQSRSEADFVLITYDGTPGPGVSLLGRMSPPDEENEGRTEFNANDERWNEQGLAPGGFSFTTLIHELGHGHGLAHPHDNGGHSGIMRGVEADGPAFDYTNGDFDLNQSVYTMMSYEDGWQKSPYGQADTQDPYGWLGSLMAFDVAAIQDKYGVNEEWATGNDTYVLKDVNAPGTFYSCIWDAGGTDAIVYSGARNANIDLRAASLLYEFGGGGWISYAFGVLGGFTIANGVTIENATGGSGNDTLIGNDAANVLQGAGGTDSMTGGKGNDIYYVDRFGDVVIELAGEGRDIAYAYSHYVLTPGSSVEILSAVDHGLSAALNLTGNGLANELWGNIGINVLDGGGDADVLVGFQGNDIYYVDNGGDLIVELAGQGSDMAYASSSFALSAGTHVEILSASNHAATTALDLTGNELANELWGNNGANVLNGGAGGDVLWGFGGNDTFTFTSALGLGNVDWIMDLQSGVDKIALGRAAFSGLASGALPAGAFHVGSAAADADDRIIYDQASGALLFDADGTGGTAAVQFATVQPGTQILATDFIVI